MNRPLLITAVGVLIVVVAIGANFFLWKQEVSQEPLENQASAPQAAAQAAADAAARAADRAREAAEKAAAATAAAAKATAKAQAPGAAPEDKAAAEKAEAAATAAEETARKAAAAADAARAVAHAAEQAATPAQSATQGTAAQQTASVPTGPAQPAAEKPVEGPSFDVVRINPRGDTVMAGRAPAGSKVRIFDHGKQIGEVEADKRGEWVFVPDKPLPPGTSELTLESTGENGQTQKSEKSVMLVVPEKGKDIAGRPTTKPSQPLAMMVPRPGAEKVTVPEGPTPSVVLQKPTPGEPGQALSIDAVDYDDSGRLSISGHAAPNAVVQLYLDNRFIGRDTSNGDGRWSVTPELSVKPGLYTLRVDQVDAAGKVVARLSIPFSRAEPLSPGVGRYVIVQPGNSLWRIARRTYGTGFQYTVIYEANAEQIANPDLIYPGQIFELPRTN